ncbi:ATP-dependent DNA helicase RecQ [Oceanispirochaeta sp.]|jgi:ATP-dependent DNA helicase RecQ|uniref:RecQ family ATP-dependent DNA helicase n=1 Tax=Oceanispirochaeta sp. TaxID=2035350 RepID=UPI00261E0667|nr:ATP-dependent DNA helicase RecQ [Oceanispirochaeta sp.]MDA3956858.1 RecQ family ATP-dependent DNA helicase [Oceanispirochaeta sp.]
MNNIKTLEDHLHHYFGFASFRGEQKRVIESALSGHSTLAVFPTGSGKSLCYQLPALLQEGLTLVISPLIALMKDQVDFLEKRQIPAARYDTSLSREEWENVNSRIKNNALKILFVSPERLGNERFIAQMKQVRIQTLVIDEIHSISEWGHNFRPDYLKLAHYYRELGIPRMIGLTATANEKVIEDICRLFSIDQDHCVISGFHRPNLFIRIHPVEDKNRNHRLLETLNKRASGPAIIYVSQQKTTREVQEFLEKNGYTARTYHAGMKAEERKDVQEWFMGSDRAVIIATIAFGMGIDKANVRQVIHYNLPKSLENYMQEIGRAGRDGEDSDCTLLYCRDDRIILENYSYGDTPEKENIYQLIDMLSREPDEFSINRYDISRDYDIRDLVARTLFTYLELESCIKSIGSFANEYSLRFLRPQEELSSQIGPERAAFLETLFATGKMGRIWLNLDLLQAERITGEALSRIQKALIWLENEGWIETKIKNMRQNYRKTRSAWNVEEMTESMMNRFAEREASDIHRIDLIEQLGLTRKCRTAALLHYFGETLEGGRCGHCDVCEGTAEPGTGVPKSMTLSEEEKTKLESLMMSLENEDLSAPRMTRFLCGISSPYLSRKKLTKVPGFGHFQRRPFTAVQSAVNSIKRQSVTS